MTSRPNTVPGVQALMSEDAGGHRQSWVQSLPVASPATAGLETCASQPATIILPRTRANRPRNELMSQAFAFPPRPKSLLALPGSPFWLPPWDAVGPRGRRPPHPAFPTRGASSPAAARPRQGQPLEGGTATLNAGRIPPLSQPFRKLWMRSPEDAAKPSIPAGACSWRGMRD